MKKIKQMSKKLDAIIEYLGIDLIEKDGYEVVEHKEMGFSEKKK